MGAIEPNDHGTRRYRDACRFVRPGRRWRPRPNPQARRARLPGRPRSWSPGWLRAARSSLVSLASAALRLTVRASPATVLRVPVVPGQQQRRPEAALPGGNVLGELQRIEIVHVSSLHPHTSPGRPKTMSTTLKILAQPPTVATHPDSA